LGKGKGKMEGGRGRKEKRNGEEVEKMAEYRAMEGDRKGREERDGDMSEKEKRRDGGCNRRGKRGKKETREKTSKEKW